MKLVSISKQLNKYDKDTEKVITLIKEKPEFNFQLKNNHFLIKQ